MPTLHHFFAQVHWFRCDVTSESDWDRLWESTEEALGKVDILVNNAGILYQRGWRKCVEVCLVREKTFLKKLIVFMGNVFSWAAWLGRTWPSKRWARGEGTL